MKARLLSLATAVLALVVCAPATSAYAGQANDNYLAVGDSVAYGVGVSTPYPELIDRLSRGLDLADNLSTSGATTGDVGLQLVGYADPGEVRELTITVGANDIGWTSVLQACLGDGSCADQDRLDLALGALSGSLESVLAGAQARFYNASISVTGYYELFGDKAKACTVAPGVSINLDNKKWLNSAVQQLNITIKSAANSVGGSVRYVDVAEAFQGHGLCDTGLPWVISGLRPSAAGHPNALGQAAYAVVLFSAGVR